jgi:hypothetical protein
MNCIDIYVQLKKEWKKVFVEYGYEKIFTNINNIEKTTKFYMYYVDFYQIEFFTNLYFKLFEICDELEIININKSIKLKLQLSNLILITRNIFRNDYDNFIVKQKLLNNELKYMNTFNKKPFINFLIQFKKSEINTYSDLLDYFYTIFSIELSDLLLL